MSLSRFKVANSIREYLEGRVVGEALLSTDSAFNPDELCTRVSVPAFSHVTNLPGNKRWVYQVTVTLNTTGATQTAVIEEIERAHRGLLSMTRLPGGTVHNIQTQLEPDMTGATTPGGVPLASCVITFIMREEA